jgi:hypothetical protein
MTAGEPFDKETHDVRPVFHKLIVNRLLQPLDDAFKEKTYKNQESKPADTFYIPFDSSFTSLAVSFALETSDDLFPRNSWPWQLTRIVPLVFVGKYYDAGDWPKGFGPLGHWVTAKASENFNRQMASSFAQQGLKKLELKDFQSDYRSWLDNEKLIGKGVVHFAKSIRELNESETKILAEFLLGEHSALLTNFAGRLRQFREHPLEDVVTECLDLMWVEGLRTLVEKEFRAIVDSNSESDEPPANEGKPDVARKPEGASEK